MRAGLSETVPGAIGDGGRTGVLLSGGVTGASALLGVGAPACPAGFARIRTHRTMLS